jgi:hypothetical protein
VKLLLSLKYSLYVVFHPFNGFYDLKHEKKGGVLSSTIIVGILIFLFVLRRYLTGYIFLNSEIRDINILTEIIGIVLPLLFWCIANWSITTLMEGEGTFRDIYITTAYALVPIIIISIPLLIISNVIVFEEAQLYTFLDSLSIFWSGLLLFFGILTIHQYTIKKTALTFIIAVIGMVFMFFIGLLFFTLIQQMLNFVLLVIKEISFRS